MVDKLRGREVKSFDDFSENFCIGGYFDSHLSKQCCSSNVTRMRGVKLQ
ncbi:hypothetical protein [Enterobacter ludwigii]